MNKIQETILKELNLKPGELFTYDSFGYNKLRFIFDDDNLEIEYYDTWFKKWELAEYDDYVLWHTIINHPELIKKVGFDENE